MQRGHMRLLACDPTHLSTRTANTLYSGHLELTSALDDKSALTFQAENESW
jgi:hypothetical protein